MNNIQKGIKKIIPVKIVATGRYLPQKIATNEDFIKEFGLKMSPELKEKLLFIGTKEHRIAALDEQPSDLLAETGKKILSKTDIKVNELTQILVSTTPPDFLEPATAAVVQKKIGAGLSGCLVADVTASCVGWLTAVEFASRIIATSEKPEKILVLAAALTSRMSARSIRHRAIFGDGAGGVLLESSSPNELSCIYGSEFLGLGEYSDVIYLPAPWSVYPPTTPENLKGYFYMSEGYPGEEKLLFKLMKKHLPLLLQRLWTKTGFTPDDIDFAILHQPSKPLFEIAVKCSGISSDKIAYNFDRYGNTVSAELPITLDENIEAGKIKRGDLILLVTYGAGITAGAMLLRY
ncbi:MAG: ketoacyl-ACP synthase III [Patescibacteria group bacterium]|nr:ketoacyl-ACP synthase III [Patescibacteria group bacterium]